MLLYEGVNYGHTFALGESALPQNVTTVGELQSFPGAGVARITFEDDGFLMQKIEGKPNFDGMRLYGKRAKQIVELIKKDWQEVVSAR